MQRRVAVAPREADGLAPAEGRHQEVLHVEVAHHHAHALQPHARHRAQRHHPVRHRLIVVLLSVLIEFPEHSLPR